MKELKELLAAADGMRGWILAQLTDEYIVDYWPMVFSTLEGKSEKIFEIRIFNQKKEVKIFRVDLQDELKCRIIDDGLNKTERKGYFDEWQLLDIDLKRTHFDEDHIVRSTTGGTFRLPLEKSRLSENTGVKVRYYFDTYRENGQSFVCDWRAVSFGEVPDGK